MGDQPVAWALFFFGFWIGFKSMAKVFGNFAGVLLLVGLSASPQFTNAADIFHETLYEQYTVSVNSQAQKGAWKCKRMAQTIAPYPKIWRGFYINGAGQEVQDLPNGGELYLYELPANYGGQDWKYMLLLYTPEQGPFFYQRWYSKAAFPDGGGWVFNGLGADDFWLGDPQQDGGIPSVTPVDQLSGNTFPGTHLLAFFTFSPSCRLWRMADGRLCAPSFMLDPRNYGGSPGAIYVPQDNPSVKGTEGWDDADQAFFGTGVPALGYQSGGKTNGREPLQWSTPPTNTANWGGYATLAFDVEPVTYHENPSKYRYWERTSPVGQPTVYEERYLTYQHHIMRPAAGSKERWVMVMGTEQAGIKPYCEMRKPNGEAYRFYCRGHAPSATNPFLYNSDGLTRNPWFSNASTQSEFGIFFYLFNSADGASWPGMQPFGGAAAQFDPGKTAPQRVADVVGGTKLDANGVISGRVDGDSETENEQDDYVNKVRRNAATSRPSFLRMNEGEWVTCTSANEAANAAMEFFSVFTDANIVNAELSIKGHYLMDMSDIWRAIFMWPEKAQDNDGVVAPVLIVIRWLANLSLVYLTGLYVWRRLAWAMALRHPDEAADVPVNPIPTLH